MRRKTVEMISRVENRVHKVLEACGVKLGSVVSDLFGATGTAILTQLASNRTHPVALAQLARGSLKNKKRDLVLALESSFDAHDALLLGHQLQIHKHLDAERQKIEFELNQISRPHQELIERLAGIPGIDRHAALSILGETGPDMSPWADGDRFAAWAGLCPGNHESAGKRKKISVRKGNPFLKSTLVQAATAAVRTKGSYYQVKFRRLTTRRGYKRAVVAIAHSMLLAIYHMIRDNTPYRELGANWLDKRSAESKGKTLVKQLERLGYRVQLAPALA